MLFMPNNTEACLCAVLPFSKLAPVDNFRLNGKNETFAVCLKLVGQ